MNRNFDDRNDKQYHTRRSERYRHPERDYQFDDYGAAARGGYGNESYSGTWGNQGNEMGGSRNISNRGRYDTSGTSRNYGNMGSYGGAQGFGSSRGGYSSQRHYDSDTNYNFDSGMGSPREGRRSGYNPAGHRAYGYQSDYDSAGSFFGNDASQNLYGQDVSRRFQGPDQNRYHFDQDNYNAGSGSFRNQERNNDRNNYGGSGGNYMGSGYNRSSQGDYGATEGNYGSTGSYDRGNSSMNYGEPYGMSGYSRGGYGQRDSNDSRMRYSNSDSNYIGSRNRSRSFDRDHDRMERERNRERY